MNEVKLSGVANVRKTYPAREGKKALVFGSIKTDAGYIDIKAFEKAAEDFGNAADTQIEITGKLLPEKPKDAPKGTPWKLVVVVEHVTEHAPEGKEEEPF